MQATKAAPPTPTFPSRIGLPESDRQILIELLNGRLADTADLYSQVKHAHWNVKGPNFFQLHQLFDQLAAELIPYIDLIAERATALGGAAMGTTRMAAANSLLPEYPVEASEGQRHLNRTVLFLEERYEPDAFQRWADGSGLRRHSAHGHDANIRRAEVKPVSNVRLYMSSAAAGL